MRGVLPLALKAGKLNETDYLSDDELIFPNMYGYSMGVPRDEARFKE